MEYERNRLCVIQSLAMMTYWYDTPDDQKDSTHWLVIALSLARRCGLDQDMSDMNLSYYQRRMSRRIWWACVSRDAQCALGLKGPLALQFLDSEIPPLTVEDFDLGDVPEDAEARFGYWPALKHRLLRLASVAQCTLQVHLRSILTRQYRLGAYRRRSADNGGKSSKMALLPVVNQTTRDGLQHLDQDLRTWRSSLPPELQDTEITPDISEPAFEPFVVFRSFLHMLYHTCFIMIYRPWLPVKPQSDVFSADATLQDKAQGIVRDSAHAITDIAIELHQLDLARLLPQISLATLLAAAVSHACDIFCASEQMHRAGLRAFGQCTHLMNELRENFYSADFSADFCKILAQAKRFSEVTRPDMASREWIGEGFDDQISRLSANWGYPLPSRGASPAAERQENIAARVMNRPAPDALDPQETVYDMNAGAVTGNMRPSWAVDSESNRAYGDNHQSSQDVRYAFDATFWDETVDLLGIPMAGFQPGMFESLGFEGVSI
jgi:hypothetical protein